MSRHIFKFVRFTYGNAGDFRKTGKRQTKGNGDDVSYLDISRDCAGIDLTHDRGKPPVVGEYGIKKTTKVCSVYTRYVTDDAGSTDEAVDHAE